MLKKGYKNITKSNFHYHQIMLLIRWLSCVNCDTNRSKGKQMPCGCSFITLLVFRAYHVWNQLFHQREPAQSSRSVKAVCPRRYFWNSYFSIYKTIRQFFIFLRNGKCTFNDAVFLRDIYTGKICSNSNLLSTFSHAFW